MNVIALTGNLCKDLELKYTKNGKEYLENTIGVSKGIKNKETGEYETDFIQFVCFEKKAVYLNEYSKKGDRVELTGKLRVDTWKDEQGNSKTRTYVVADTIKVLSNKKKEDIPVEQLKTKTNFDEKGQIQITDEDIPW